MMMAGVRWGCGKQPCIDRSILASNLPPPPSTQLNIANPSTGQQHVVEVEDEKKL